MITPEKRSWIWRIVHDTISRFYHQDTSRYNMFLLKFHGVPPSTTSLVHLQYHCTRLQYCDPSSSIFTCGVFQTRHPWMGRSLMKNWGSTVLHQSNLSFQPPRNPNTKDFMAGPLETMEGHVQALVFSPQTAGSAIIATSACNSLDSFPVQLRGHRAALSKRDDHH